MAPPSYEYPRSNAPSPFRGAESTLGALLFVLAVIRRVNSRDAGPKTDDRAERETLSSIRSAAYSIRSILSERATELKPEVRTRYCTAILDAVEDAVEVDQCDRVLERECAPCKNRACPFQVHPSSRSHSSAIGYRVWSHSHNGFVQKTNKKPYPNCHALCHSADFCFPNSAARDHLRQALTTTFDELQISLPDNDEVLIQPAQKRRNPQWDISTSAGHAFHAISQCRQGLHVEGCHIIDHLEAHLALATYLGIDDEDEHFVDLLLALDTDRQRCDEVRMRAHCPILERADTGIGATRPKVMFADQGRRRPKKKLKEISHFCELLSASKMHHNAIFRVDVSVDAKSALWQQVHPQTHRELKEADLSSTVSLAALLASDTRDLSDMAKLVLAVILSYSLFYLFDGPWLGPRQGAEWSQRNIIFFKKGGKVPLRPFLRSDLRCNSGGADEEDSLHQYPALLAFGITLLEIHLGGTIESFLGLNEPLTSLDDRYARACEVFEKRKPFIRGEYREAIKACLDTQFGMDEEEADWSGDEDEDESGGWEAEDEPNIEHLRGIIFNEIVRPLHDDLEKSFGTLMEFQNDLDKQAASMDFRSGLSVDVGGEHPTNSHDHHKSSTHYKEHTYPDISRVSIKHAGNGNLHALPGDPSPQPSVPHPEYGPIDEWFARFRNLEALFPLRHLRPGDSRRVRLAIIDTGIDMGHIEMQAAASNGQIVKVCTWVDGRGGAEDESGGDSEGHGTHIASVILGMAPHVDLYIARVTKTRELFNDEAENVAKAIRTAASIWKCDIISLSLGFTRGVPCIQTELESAIDAGTLVFAAASNDGANSGLAYPAWHSRVFCTYSTDGYGNKSPFNPPPEQPSGADGFSIVGQHIRGAWPSNLTPDGANDLVRRLSGTSCATPVAAAVASCVLGFANIAHESNKFKTQSFLRLGSYDGMRRVLWKMANPRDGYHYLNPFRFFNREKCEIEAEMWKALNPEK